MMDSKKETVSDNCLISDFMGGFNYDQQTRHIGANLPFRLNEWSDYKDMQYQTSWSWLMPVVERFFEAMNNIEDKVLGNLKRGIIERAIWDALYKRKTIADVAKILADEIHWFNSQSPDTIK